MKECCETAHQIACTIEKYTEEFDLKLKNALENLSKAVGSAVKITDAKRKEIVCAMGYKQGHWRKCPNGHIYIITECGGAMEVVRAMGYKQGHWCKCPNGHIYLIECGGAMQQSRCNECGAEIGGGSHRLLASNSVATEMDGATGPAWPQ